MENSFENMEWFGTLRLLVFSLSIGCFWNVDNFFYQRSHPCLLFGFNFVSFFGMPLKSEIYSPWGFGRDVWIHNLRVRRYLSAWKYGSFIIFLAPVTTGLTLWARSARRFVVVSWMNSLIREISCEFCEMHELVKKTWRKNLKEKFKMRTGRKGKGKGKNDRIVTTNRWKKNRRIIVSWRNFCPAGFMGLQSTPHRSRTPRTPINSIICVLELELLPEMQF